MTGYIAKKTGNLNVAFLGLVALALSLLANLTGISFMHYWIDLVLLGIGWNFTFICGTTILTESYKFEHRFKFQGINDFFVFTFNAFASLSAGASVLTLGWYNLNRICIIILAVMIISGLLIRLNIKKSI